MASKVIIALDFSSERQVLEFIEPLQPQQCRLKVGKELFTQFGSGIVNKLVKRGFDVFLDLKYHDIPNTVAKACRAAADLGVWMINVHTLGGRRMLAAAKESLAQLQSPPLLIGVTVLTSMTAEDLIDIGVDCEPGKLVKRLALLGKDEGLDGVVCSAHEASELKAELGSAFKLVTPGIRPAGDAQNDQRRTMTPQEAVQAGADYLVIGRPLTNADDYVGKLLTINSDIS